MSYPDKNETVTKEEWINRLENAHIQRADMNKLIMNYLVTGNILGSRAWICNQYLIRILTNVLV